MLNYLSLFSGIGAPEKALTNLGIPYHLVNYCEIDKYASKSYAAVHGVSEDLNLWDVTKITKDSIKERIDLITYGFPCLTEKSLVLVKNKGYISIKDVKTGDEVLTHTNEYSVVTNSMYTGDKNIFEIHAMGFDSIECTNNHPFYVRTRHRVNTHKNGKSITYRYFDEPIYKECKDLSKDDYLGYAINTNSIVPKWGGVEYSWQNSKRIQKSNIISSMINDKNFWWIIGRYIADGWIVNKGIKICCGKHKKRQIDEKLDELGFNYHINEERTVFKYHISIKELSIFVEQFGSKAYGKFIPGFMFDMPIDLLEAFIEGYWSGDGCCIKGLYKATSVSRNLIYGLGQLIAKVYHVPFSIYKTVRKPTCIIENRIVNQRDTYTITFKKEKKKQSHAFYENGYIWFPIRSITNTMTIKPVYDLTVETNHSFTANGCIVHNCQDLSNAGKQRGFVDENGNRTRSGLFFEALRIIKDYKPKYAIAENVKALTSKKFEKEFKTVLDSLEEAGYDNYWKVLNAKDFGIPQNRERVFIISIRKDISTKRGGISFQKLFH